MIKTSMEMPYVKIEIAITTLILPHVVISNMPIQV